MAPADSQQLERWARIDRRADKVKRPGRPFIFVVKRIAEIEKLLTYRWGQVLPDDDAGREDARIMVNHIAGLSIDPDKRIIAWLARRTPWMPPAEAEALKARAMQKRIRYRASTLAARFNLTAAERRLLDIRTIGAVDRTKEQLAADSRQRELDRKAAARRTAGAKTRAEYEANSLARTKPWERLGMSRATWYRTGRPHA